MSKNKANKTYIKVEISLDSKEQLKKRAQEEGNRSLKRWSGPLA
jgi:hypothetical protein